MEPDQRREIYLEHLGEWQKLAQAISRDDDASDEERALLDEVKALLDRAKPLVFGAAQGDLRDARKRSKARKDIRARIAFITGKIRTLEEQAESGN